MPAVDEYFWENLLLYIEERKVIPIIGPELVTVSDGGREVPFQQWLAIRLQKALGLPSAELGDAYSLNDVVSLYARQHRPREDLFPRIFSLLKAEPIEPPASLRALARIDGFPLFVSLTFDGLVQKAVAAARPTAAVTQIAYSPSDVRDLPEPVASLAAPVVFQLLGKCSPSPDYAICDEDVIEFLHAMQAEHRRPKLLFDELRGNHLLLLGCSFDDWLTRFFLRVVRGTPFSENRKHREFVVDSVAARAPGLVMFLASYSSNTQLVEGMTAAAFVEELARRWEASHPAAAVADAAAPVPVSDAAAAPIPEGSVFVSYASEDLGPAQQLARGLQDGGIDVWFDKDRLCAGARWERQIRRGIESASLFLPVVSRSTISDGNRRSWFWMEWNAASTLSSAMSPDEEFILPVVVDDLDLGHPALPDVFRSCNWERLPGGTPSTAFAGRVKQLVRDFHRRRRAA